MYTKAFLGIFLVVLLGLIVAAKSSSTPNKKIEDQVEFGISENEEETNTLLLDGKFEEPIQLKRSSQHRDRFRDNDRGFGGGRQDNTRDGRRENDRGGQFNGPREDDRDRRGGSNIRYKRSALAEPEPQFYGGGQYYGGGDGYRDNFDRQRGRYEERGDRHGGRCFHYRY